jgi:hypothetical protein
VKRDVKSNLLKIAIQTLGRAGTGQRGGGRLLGLVRQCILEGRRKNNNVETFFPG